MRFLFLSDTHFTCEKGIEPPIWLNRLVNYKWDELREEFVSEVKRLKPDVIVHCGDFTQYGTLDDFLYGKEIMD